MSRKILKSLLVICCALLVAELVFLGVMLYREKETTPETTPATTQAPTTEETAATTEAATIPETTAPPTEAETEPTETEPKEIRYTLTFAGDCTLAADPGNYASPHGFIQTIGTDYGYPFRNVVEFFENDDFTIINLESVLANEGAAANKLFTFRGPTAYTEIMTGSSVEAVTLANNHTADYGKVGYDSTTKALTDAGIWFVEEDRTTMITTDSGLTIGLYADTMQLSEADIQKNVKFLKDQGAEIIICAFHWGTEGSYRPTAQQKQLAHAAIDAGADVVYGHHPHVLQPIEEYGDGYIFYSLGNFSFGGNHFPRDMDSAILQLEVVRDENGKVSLGELIRIPVSISSRAVQNNFQPIPYEEGSKEYDRTLSKLDGSFTGPDLVVNYDNLKPTQPPAETTPPATDAPAGEEPPAATDAPTPPPAATDAPTPPPAENPPAENSPDPT